MRVALDVLNGYLIKLHAREGWRMRSWEDQDYIQEGLLQYLAIEHHYPAIEEPKHLMALFKTHWMRHIHDKSKKEHVHVDESELSELEAAAVLEGFECESAMRHLTGDAQALVTLFTVPNDALTDFAQGIVFTAKQAKTIATRLGITVGRVRNAAVEVLKEFSMPTSIQILATATGLQQQTHEKREEYLKRLVEGVASLSDSAWEALPTEAQAVHNSMVEAKNNGKSLIDVVPEAQDKETPEAVKPKRAGNGGKGPRTSKDGTPVAQSPTGRARELMTLDEHISPADVSRKLVEEGLKPPNMNSIQAMRSEIRSVIKILKEHQLYGAAAPTA